MSIDANKLQDFSVHSMNWILGGISKSLQVIGQLQVDQNLTEDEKNAQINMHQSLILNLCAFIIPFIDIAEDMFPQYKTLLDWIKNLYADAQAKGIMKACTCAGCGSQSAPAEQSTPVSE